MRRAKYSAKKVYLPKASTIGYGTYYAKPGFWLTWADPQQNGNTVRRNGRVLGRIECAAYEIGLGTQDCVGWIAVMQLADDMTHAYVRWVNPEWVEICYEKPPAQLLAWITGDEWPKQGKDVARLLAMANYGTCSESYISQRNDPEKPYNGRNGLISADEYNSQYVLS
jgi:hypothetical protein